MGSPRSCLQNEVSFLAAKSTKLTVLLLVLLNRLVVGEAAKAVMVLQMEWLDGVQVTNRIGRQGQDGTMLRSLVIGHKNIF